MGVTLKVREVIVIVAVSEKKTLKISRKEHYNHYIT